MGDRIIFLHLRVSYFGWSVCALSLELVVAVLYRFIDGDFVECHSTLLLETLLTVLAQVKSYFEISPYLYDLLILVVLMLLVSAKVFHVSAQSVAENKSHLR